MNLSKLNVIFFYLGNRLLYSPLEAMFTLLIFILSIEMDANPIQLTIIAATKPIAPLFAFQISSLIIHYPSRIPKYLAFLNCLGCVPVLLFPFISNVWFYTFSYFLFMICLKSTYPAWIELLKINLDLKKYADLVSKGSALNYSLIIIIPLIFSFWMDVNKEVWKYLFCGLGFIQLLSVPFLFKMKKTLSIQTTLPPELKKFKHWKNGLDLCLKNTEFTKYLVLFFLGGAGLVLLQPILPIFFKEYLHLTYIQLTLAVGICKGVSFMLSLPLWNITLKKMSLYSLNACIGLFSSFFIIFLWISHKNISLFFLAYFMYGIMQSGSELSLNLSSPIFAKNNESILYSGMNLAFIGIRGVVFPIIGQLIFIYSNFFIVLFVALSFCLFSILYALNLESKPLNNQSVI